jgi:hypothetical protein
MAVRNGDGIHFLVLYEIKAGQSLMPLPFRMDACIHQQTVPFDFDKPRGSPNVYIRIQVDYPHAESRQVIIISAKVSTRLLTPSKYICD